MYRIKPRTARIMELSRPTQYKMAVKCAKASWKYKTIKVSMGLYEKFIVSDLLSGGSKQFSLENDFILQAMALTIDKYTGTSCNGIESLFWRFARSSVRNCFISLTAPARKSWGTWNAVHTARNPVYIFAVPFDDNSPWSPKCDLDGEKGTTIDSRQFETPLENFIAGRKVRRVVLCSTGKWHTLS